VNPREFQVSFMPFTSKKRRAEYMREWRIKNAPFRFRETNIKALKSMTFHNKKFNIEADAIRTLEKSKKYSLALKRWKKGKISLEKAEDVKYKDLTDSDKQTIFNLDKHWTEFYSEPKNLIGYRYNQIEAELLTEIGRKHKRKVYLINYPAVKKRALWRLKRELKEKGMPKVPISSERKTYSRLFSDSKNTK
jgi:hypothetical protein